MNLSLTFTFAERHCRQALLLMLDAPGRLSDPFLEGVILDLILNGFGKLIIVVLVSSALTNSVRQSQ